MCAPSTSRRSSGSPCGSAFLDVETRRARRFDAVISAWISTFCRPCRCATSRRSGSCRAAANRLLLRSRLLPEPPAESPSTTTLGQARVLDRAVGSLPGSVEFSRADLRLVRSRALRAASRRAGPGRIHDHRACLVGSPPGTRKAGVDDRLDESGHAGCRAWSSLTLELGVAQLHRDRRQACGRLARELSSFSFSRPWSGYFSASGQRERKPSCVSALARVDVVRRSGRLL